MIDNVRRSLDSNITVIMGCNDLSASVAIALSSDRHNVHIIDEDPRSFSILPAEKVDNEQIVPIIGNGSRERGQIRGTIMEAHVFMALSQVDTRNILAALIAKQRFQIPTVVCLIEDSDRRELYGELGIVAISSTMLVTQQILKSVGT